MTKSKTAVKNADEFETSNSKRGEQMKYLGKPAGMWALFAGSFEKHLTVEFDLTAEQAKDVAARAKKKYREIIAKLRAGDRNPYSWNMDFFEYEDGSGYEARFTTCGICTLMQVLGLYDLTPALCHLDYTMSDAGGASDFVREYTLASGGPYCDCGYHKKQ